MAEVHNENHANKKWPIIYFFSDVRWVKPRHSEKQNSKKKVYLYCSMRLRLIHTRLRSSVLFILRYLTQELTCWWCRVRPDDQTIPRPRVTFFAKLGGWRSDEFGVRSSVIQTLLCQNMVYLNTAITALTLTKHWRREQHYDVRGAIFCGTFTRSTASRTFGNSSINNIETHIKYILRHVYRVNGVDHISISNSINIEDQP